MRLLKLCTILGVLAALVVPAGAINFKHAYNGPITIKIVNWDMGTIYATTPYATTDGIANVDGLTQLGFPGTQYDALTGSVYTGAQGQVKEDGWGIYKITQIYNTNNSSDILWDGAFGQANGIELFGMYYGLIDNAVKTTGDFPGTTFIQAENLTYTMFENPFGSFGAATTGLNSGEQQGSSGRLGFAAYKGITNVGGVKILEGVSVMGDITAFGGTTGPAEFQATFKPNSTSGSGDFTTRISLTDSTARDYAQFNTNGFPAGSDLIPVDISLGGHALDNSTSSIGDWTVRSQDPMEANVIPEPITMLGLLLGVGSVGGYIRRRSRQA